MTDDDTTGLDLPRRKLLGAVGAVGVSSAGTGLGTSAYLNDTESFTGNSLTAGKLNIKLRGLTVATNSNAIDVSGGTGTQNTAEVDGATGTAFFTLGDVKPGDLAIFCLEIVIVGNPAHLKLNGSFLSNDGGLTEPEGDVDSSGGDGAGDLAQNTDIQAFGPTTQSLSGSSATSLQTTLQGNDDYSFSSSAIRNGGSGTFANGGQVFVSQAFGTGTEGADYLLTNSNGNCFESGTYRIYFAMGVGTGVGNIIQSDSFDLDLKVEAVQCRHNDDTPFTDDDS